MERALSNADGLGTEQALAGWRKRLVVSFLLRHRSYRSGHAPGDGSRARAQMSLGVSRLEEGIGCRHILG
jgi:hypothetical protein